MPCASVSEKPTRVSAEYLNGGLRSVRRPSSRPIGSNAKRRQRRELVFVVETTDPTVAIARGYAPTDEAHENRRENREWNHGVGVSEAAAGIRCPALNRWPRPRQEVVGGSHLWLRVERRERRRRHERIDEPVAVSSLERDVEEDRPDFRTGSRLQQQLDPRAVRRRLVDRPAVELAPERRVRIDADVAARPLAAVLTVPERGCRELVRVPDVLPAYRARDERVERRIDRAPVCRREPMRLRPGGRGER